MADGSAFTPTRSPKPTGSTPRIRRRSNFARKAIEAFDAAERRGSASIAVEGVFIDYPIVFKARRIVRLADAIVRREQLRV
jgi:hypothetical protein